MVVLHNQSQKAQDHFLRFVSFCQLQFFTSLGRILFILAYQETDQFDTIFHIVLVCLSMFIQKVKFVLKNVTFHLQLVEFVVQNQCQNWFSKFILLLYSCFCLCIDRSRSLFKWWGLDFIFILNYSSIGVASNNTRVIH